MHASEGPAPGRFNRGGTPARATRGRLRRLGLPLLAALTAATLTPATGRAAPESPYTKQHEITVDATVLEPPTWWHVPGITPLIWSLDPASTEAYRTTQVGVLKLKPGNYRFGTFTFDFPFKVTLDGVLDFAPSLDQCVKGRGTRTLEVRCSRTQPYGGEREYWREQQGAPNGSGQAASPR